MIDAPKFSVIIPVFNKWELTAGCLRSLREHTSEYPYEVIVLDNASGDATASDLLSLGRELFGARFRRIRFEENRNFGPACNIGAAVAKAPLLFFLNNDTLLTQGWAPPLLRALEEDPKLAGVGPLLLYDDQSVQHLGVAFCLYGVLHLYRGFPVDHPVVKKRRKFQVITAAALLVPKDLFLAHDGFFDGYKNGFEDVDLCLRMHATGKYFSTIPESVVYHLESQTPGRKKHDRPNNVLLNDRCGKLFKVDLHRFGRDDGFDVFLNDLLDLSLVLPRDESERLLDASRDKPDAVWQELLKANPYWDSGHEYVADRLESAGRYGEALDLRISVAAMLGTGQSYKNLIRCAVRAGNETTRERAEYYYKIILNCKFNREGADALAGRAIEMADRAGDPWLVELVREKMQTLSGKSA